MTDANNAMPVEIQFTWTPDDQGNSGTLVASASPDDKMVDRLAITSAAKRLAFADKAMDRWPGLWATREEIMAELDSIAAAEADKDRRSRADDTKIAKRVLAALIKSGVELFRDATGDADARPFMSVVDDNGRLVTMPINGRQADG